MSIITVYSRGEPPARRTVTAEANRALLRQAGVRTVSIVGGPGCGKTTLIERTIRRTLSDRRAGIIVCTDGRGADAVMLNALHRPIVQLELGGDESPDPWLLRSALDHFDLKAVDLLLIENVGTYAGRPAQLGQEFTVALFSVAAGHDKAAKHPATVVAADVVLLSKTDLLPFVPFDVARFRADVERLNPSARFFALSAKTGDGLDAWIEWMRLGAPGSGQTPQKPADLVSAE